MYRTKAYLFSLTEGSKGALRFLYTVSNLYCYRVFDQDKLRDIGTHRSKSNQSHMNDCCRAFTISRKRGISSGLRCTRCSFPEYRSVETWSWRSRRGRFSGDSPLLFLLRCKRIVPAHQHTAHHVQHRIALARYLDSEIHLSNLSQRLVPAVLFQLRSVMRFELFVQICATSLDGK